ncbi:MAG: hypothetical protein DWQ04_23735 [Chloroflexi bacterium]|nr:MAG: hypothetical protein DWQ04_23735 [Chloroflexota bacterium]
MDEMITNEARLDEAFDSYPLAPLPTGFADRVMSEVSRTPQLDAQFRLQFIDLVLPTFITTFGTAVLLTTLWLTGYWIIEDLPQPTWMPAFSSYLEAMPMQWIAIGAVIIIFELLVSLLIASQVISDQPQVVASGNP